MFGILKDIASIAGEITGNIIAIPTAIVAGTLSIPVAAVKAAKEAGCETYEEIREFFDDNY